MSFIALHEQQLGPREGRTDTHGDFGFAAADDDHANDTGWWKGRTYAGRTITTFDKRHDVCNDRVEHALGAPEQSVVVNDNEHEQRCPDIVERIAAHRLRYNLKNSCV